MMGLLIALFVMLLSVGLFFLFGLNLWVVIVIALILVVGLACTIIFGHRGFGGGGNADLLTYIFILVLVFAVVIPKYLDYSKIDKTENETERQG